MTAVAVGALLATSVPAQAATGYDRCPYGRACVFTGWNGGGNFSYPVGCGHRILPSYTKNLVKSVRTHGNRVILYDTTSVESDVVGYINPWTTTNLAQHEYNRAESMWVYC